MKTNTHIGSYLAHFFLELKIFQVNAVEIKTQILWFITFSFENQAVYELKV